MGQIFSTVSLRGSMWQKKVVGVARSGPRLEEDGCRGGQ